MVKKFEVDGLRTSIATMQRNIAALEKQAHKSPKIANKLKAAKKRLEKRVKLLEKMSKPGFKPSPKLQEKPRKIPIDESLRRNMAFAQRTGDSKSYDKKVDALMRDLEKA